MITNNSGVPHQFFDALVYYAGKYSKGVSKYSVSDLVSPPQQVILKQRYHQYIKHDITELSNTLLGTLGHLLLERVVENDSNARKIYEAVEDIFVKIYPYLSPEQSTMIQGELDKLASDYHEKYSTYTPEKRYYLNIDGVIISGQIDIVINTGTIEDYKFLGVNTIMFDDGLTHYHANMNYYNMLLFYNGITNIREAKLNVFLKDWSIIKSIKERDYPRTPFPVIDIPLRNPADVLEEVRQKVAVLEYYSKLPDENLIECTPEQKWEKSRVFKVYPTGSERKRATRVFDDYNEALVYTQRGGFDIVESPGKRNNCEIYCAVKDFCAQKRREDLKLKT